MKTFFKFGLGMATFLLAGCSSNNLDEIAPKEESSFPEYNVTMTIPDFVWEEGETRTTLTPTSTGLSFAWAAGDVVGIYSAVSLGGNLATFKITEVGADAKSASFNGGGFSLMAGTSYTAIYPYNGLAIEQETVPVTYEGQNLTENSATNHIAPYDYMTASATATGLNQANFTFDHIGAILRFRMTVPAAGHYVSMKVIAPDKSFILNGTLNLTDATPTIAYNAEDTSKELTMKLGADESGLELTSSNLQLTAFMIIPPVDLSGKNLTVILTDSNGDIAKYTCPGKSMTAGKAYAYNCTITESTIIGSGSGYPFG